jgi:hypothetical protein
MAKTTRIEGIAIVTRTGSACIGCMGPESPYVDFIMERDTCAVAWWTDNVMWLFEKLSGVRYGYLMHGDRFHVEALVRARGGKWRVWKMIKIMREGDNHGDLY